MENIKIGEVITALRKKHNVTQEQLAEGLLVSPQAISKWENGACLPDTCTLPLIADFFGVSVDYLFRGEDIVYDDIYGKCYQKVAKLGQMTGFEEALNMYAHVHHALSRGNLISRGEYRNPYATHISGKEGLSLLHGDGYAALITRKFFEKVDKDTAEFGARLLGAMSDVNRFKVLMAVISMSDISYSEMKELIGLDDDALRLAINTLKDAEILLEKESKHKALGSTFEIGEMYHTCLCIIIATVQMQAESTPEKISCCMGFGDYPINL